MPPFCLSCNKKPTCKAICKPLEKYLNKLQAKEGYSDRHTRRKEIPYDPAVLEDLQTAYRFKKEMNWKVKMEE